VGVWNASEGCDCVGGICFVKLVLVCCGGGKCYGFWNRWNLCILGW